MDWYDINLVPKYRKVRRGSGFGFIAKEAATDPGARQCQLRSMMAYMAPAALIYAEYVQYQFYSYLGFVIILFIFFYIFFLVLF